jgi:hypothetical protein
MGHQPEPSLRRSLRVTLLERGQHGAVQPGIEADDRLPRSARSAARRLMPVSLGSCARIKTGGTRMK